MRDYTNFDKYLDQMSGEIYSQPPDPAHTAWAQTTLAKFADNIDGGLDGKRVLDVGCGQGFMQAIFESQGAHYLGRCPDRIQPGAQCS